MDLTLAPDSVSQLLVSYLHSTQSADCRLSPWGEAKGPRKHRSADHPLVTAAVTGVQ